MAGQAQLHQLITSTELPFVARGVALVESDPVRQQLRRMLGRAMTGEILGGNAEQPPHAEQLAFDQRLGQRREHLEGHVEPLFDGIDHAIVDDHVHLDIRVQLAELGKQPGEVANSEPWQHLHAQLASGFGPLLAHLLGQRIDPSHHVGTFLVVGFADLGQPYMAGTAVEQGGIDELFQLLDTMADHRAGHP